MISRILTITVILFFAFLIILNAQDRNEQSTKVVLLGTGNPNPDPEHSGCSIAIIVNDTPYIVDFGPGLVRRAAELSPQFGFLGFGNAPEEIYS
jgi:ribonuclease Z